MSSEQSEKAKIFSDRVTEVFDAREASIDYDAKVTEKLIDLNKQNSQFFERLMLISLGTLGLSITSLVSLASKTPIHPSRPVFMHYVIPAWVLLLFSSFACRNMMALMLRSNNHLIQALSKTGSAHHKQAIWRSAIKIIPFLKDEPHEALRTAAAKLEELSTSLQKDFETSSTSPTTDFSVLVQTHKWQGNFSIWSMQAGFILLAIAAVKIFFLL